MKSNQVAAGAQIFSLLNERWIPILRTDGRREWIRPAEIVSDIVSNPVVALAWGRADFDMATREFLIGLLAVACGTKADQDGWDEWFSEPPSVQDLDAAFQEHAAAFVLDGPGARFEQDLEDFAGEEVAVGQLLIEAPGANTVKRNLDHFIRRGGVNVLSRAGAAIALFTLQTYAPSGGAGHRVSVRGGGPLTTLLLPGPLNDEPAGAPLPLWRTLWLAVPHVLQKDGTIFPWQKPTRVSDKNLATTPSEVHALQAFWGMPRRIRLVFEANKERLPCDITGIVDDVVVRAYRTRPYGAKYESFSHPLSPHYRGKVNEPFLPVHGQPGGIGYRHWLGLVWEPSGDLRRVAKSVSEARRRLEDIDETARRQARLLAAGYDMDNMKARAFIESELPLYLVREEYFPLYSAVIERMIDAAKVAEQILRMQVRAALFVKKTEDHSGFEKTPKSGGVLDLARLRFWQRTEGDFSKHLADWSAAIETVADGDTEQKVAAENKVGKEWLKDLRTTVLELFHELVPVDDLGSLNARSLEARVQAQRGLYSILRGHGSMGKTLYNAVGLDPPKVAKKRGKTA